MPSILRVCRGGLLVLAAAGFLPATAETITPVPDGSSLMMEPKAQSGLSAPFDPRSESNIGPLGLGESASRGRQLPASPEAPVAAAGSDELVEPLPARRAVDVAGWAVQGGVTLLLYLLLVRRPCRRSCYRRRWGFAGLVAALFAVVLSASHSPFSPRLEPHESAMISTPELAVRPLLPAPALSAVIPDGQRAMTVEVDEAVGIFSFILPGSFVDVVAVITPTDQGDTGPLSKTVLQEHQGARQRCEH